MRTLLFQFVLTCFVLAFSLLAWADQPPQVSPADDAEWQAIRAIKPMYEEAIEKGNLTKLEPFFSSNFSGVMVTGESVKGFKGLVDYYNKIQELVGSGGKLTTKVNYEPGTLIGSVAMANGTTDETVVTGSGTTFTFSAPWTATFVKENGSWKIFRTHSSLDPVHNVFVDAFGRKANMIWGIGGLILGGLASLIMRKISGSCCRK